MGCRNHPRAGTHPSRTDAKHRLCDKPVLVRLECDTTGYARDFTRKTIPVTLPTQVKAAIYRALAKNTRSAAAKVMKGQSCICPICGDTHSTWTIMTCNYFAL